MTSTILLSHLQTPNALSARTPSIPLPTLQSLLSHHFSTAPSTSTSTSTLTVTQLTATAISSPFFLHKSQSFEYAKLQAFETAFRHAVHILQQQRFKEDGANYINISRWTWDVIKGIQGGHPILRLAACGGILLGVEDLKNDMDVNAKVPIKLSRTLVEAETVVALAEVLDSTTIRTEWEDEFQHQGQPQHPSQLRNTLLLAFILASHSLPLIDSQRLTALPSHTLAPLLTSTLVSFFDLPDRDPNLNPDTNAGAVTDISHVPSLAKLTSVIFSALLDSTHTRTYTRTLRTVSDTFNTLLDLSRTMEQTQLFIDPSDQIPKQFLFTAVIIFQSVLSSIVYLCPDITPSDTSITPPSLALISLQTLTHLSLVISQFGGITKAFEQLQKVFYLSVDIILAPSRRQDQKDVKRKMHENVEAYVQHLSNFLQSQSPETATTLPFRAKLSFALSAFEQLVPALSPLCTINHVWGVCYPYVTNLSESNREIYESSHSVVLSMLVHDPQKLQEATPISDLLHSKKERILWTTFTQRLVPFYAKCLIEDTTLTILQLRHAYSSVVQCANRVLSTHTHPNTTVAETDAATALPWYCVQLILDTIEELSSSSESPSPLPLPLASTDRLHRLHLMLISTLPSLPLELLDRCLESVRVVLVRYSDVDRGKDEERKQELVQTLFELLLSEQMGDGEKVVGMKWWYENLGLLRGVGGEKEKVKEEGLLQSRL